MSENAGSEKAPTTAARAWLMATRPQTLPAALAPVLVGLGCVRAAGLPLRIAPALAAALGALLLQIGANLANDLFDAKKGADGPDRLGPTRAVAAGLLSARAVAWATAFVFALALLDGSYLVYSAGWPVVAIGLASIASAIAYTGGPWPLGYHGLGDLFVMIFFGFVAVLGTVFVVAGALPQLAWIAAFAPGALATNILVVNNLRDRVTDARAGKRTLAVRLGRRGALIEYAVLLFASQAVPVLLVILKLAPLLSLLALLTLPLGLVLLRKVAASDGRALNPLLARSAQLLLAHALLFSAGLALG